LLHDRGLRNQRPVAISSFNNEHDALQALWGIYARLGVVPEPGEVLLCESSTSVEQIDVFLHRWASCDDCDWQFTLVGVERLLSEAHSLLCCRVLFNHTRLGGSAFLLLMHTSGDASKGTKHAVLNALRLVRLLTAMKRFQLLGVVSPEILLAASTVFMLLFLLMYLFSAFGVALFGGLISRNPKNELSYLILGTNFSDNEYWANNFNDMLRGMYVLFNLLVVNNWTDCEIEL
jgi:hypothetical protein